MKLVSTHKPKFISHLAAQSFPRTSFDIPLETLQTNIIGTATLLESIKSVKLSSDYDPIVHICSSSEVYGKAIEGVKLDESQIFMVQVPIALAR